MLLTGQIIGMTCVALLNFVILRKHFPVGLLVEGQYASALTQRAEVVECVQ